MTRDKLYIKFLMTDGTDIEIGIGDRATTGTAVGYSFCPSWGRDGYAGGVADRKHMLQMAEWVLFETKPEDCYITFPVQGAGYCDIGYTGSGYKIKISWALPAWANRTTDLQIKEISQEEMARMAAHVMKTSDPTRYRDMRLGEIGV